MAIWQDPKLCNVYSNRVLPSSIKLKKQSKNNMKSHRHTLKKTHSKLIDNVKHTFMEQTPSTKNNVSNTIGILLASKNYHQAFIELPWLLCDSMHFQCSSSEKHPRQCTYAWSSNRLALQACKFYCYWLALNTFCSGSNQAWLAMQINEHPPSIASCNACTCINKVIQTKQNKQNTKAMVGASSP